MEEYRVIPGFERYKVSKGGIVLDTSAEEAVKIYWPDRSNTKNRKRYPTVTIYDATRAFNRTQSVHRLVALAWVDNPDKENLVFVNHKDGDKDNFYHDNLEWVTPGGNMDHAVETGLRTDALKCRVRDTRTGEEHEFPSVRRACSFMGLSPDFYRSNTRPVRSTRLIAEFFEVRVEGDERPWMHPIGASVKIGRYIVTVTPPDGEVVIFYDVRELIKTMRLWNMPSMSIVECVKRMAVDYPDHVIEVLDQYEKRQIQALKLDTREEFSTETLTDMSRLTKINHGRLRTVLSRDRIIAEKGYAFRYATNDPWPTDIESPVVRAWGIMAEHRDGSTLTFPSLRAAANHFKVDRSMVKSRLGMSLRYKDWLFKEIAK